jgi:hypothetical protein
MAVAECNVVLARVGNSLNCDLRAHCNTVISAHRKALTRAGFRLRETFLSSATKDGFCNKVTINIFV